MTDAQKRQYVYNLYDGPKWKKRVDKMPDAQIVAIFLKHHEDGSMPEHEESEELDISIPSQPHLNGLSNGRGPHANEDLFEIY